MPQFRYEDVETLLKECFAFDTTWVRKPTDYSLEELSTSLRGMDGPKAVVACIALQRDGRLALSDTELLRVVRNCIPADPGIYRDPHEK